MYKIADWNKISHNFTAVVLNKDWKLTLRLYSNILAAIFMSQVFTVLTVQAQDPEFSQFYANPLYLNPALTGTGECSRIIFNYRNQWPSVPGNFVTYNAAADFSLESISSGLGILINSDNAGDGTYITNRASLIYSYHLTVGREVQLNAGAEATFHYQKFNFDNLIFQDMIDPATGDITGQTGEMPPDNTTVMVSDFSFGLLLGVKEIFFIGISADHLSEPSLNYYNQTDKNKLYRKYTVHTGVKISTGKGYGNNNTDFVFLPQLLFQMQGNMHQMNIGINVERYPIVVGAWFRHNFENTDGAIFMIGLKQKRFRFGYSYDLSMSKLKGTSGGAHEVSLTMLINCNKKRNRPGAIKCPEF